MWEISSSDFPLEQNWLNDCLRELLYDTDLDKTVKEANQFYKFRS